MSTDNRSQGAVAVQTDFERFALDHNAHVHCLGCNGCLIDPAFYIQSYPGHVWCMACRERMMLSQIAPHISEIDISLGSTPAMMPIESAEDLHVAIKLITGHCTTQHIKGTPYVLRVPKSTDFASMKADEWEAYYPRVLDAIHQRALPQVEIPEVEQELSRLAS